MYKGVGGEYYGGDEAWNYLLAYIGIDLKLILTEIANERTPDISDNLKEILTEIKEEETTNGNK